MLLHINHQASQSIIQGSPFLLILACRSVFSTLPFLNKTSQKVQVHAPSGFHSIDGSNVKYGSVQF